MSSDVFINLCLCSIFTVPCAFLILSPGMYTKFKEESLGRNMYKSLLQYMYFVSNHWGSRHLVSIPSFVIGSSCITLSISSFASSILPSGMHYEDM